MQAVLSFSNWSAMQKRISALSNSTIPIRHKISFGTKLYVTVDIKDPSDIFNIKKKVDVRILEIAKECNAFICNIEVVW